MGWYGQAGETRAQLVKRIVDPAQMGEGWSVEAHCAVGNTLWAVVRPPTEPAYIACYLLAKNPDGWSYKPMAECMGPFYYSCPLAYLELAPEVNPGWRAEVRAYHAEKRIQRLRRHEVQIGETIALVGATIPHVRILSTKPLVGLYNGQRYRIPQKMVGNVLEHLVQA